MVRRVATASDPIGMSTLASAFVHGGTARRRKKARRGMEGRAEHAMTVLLWM
jgi:hypothetical protein